MSTGHRSQLVAASTHHRRRARRSLLAALGELVVERAGVLNLGVEGMMLVGAVAGFAVTAVTGNGTAGTRRGGAGRRGAWRCCSAC